MHTSMEEDSIDIDFTIIGLSITLCIIVLYLLPIKKLFGIDTWFTPKKLITYSQKPRSGVEKQVFDIYSFTHITHGIIFYFLIHYIDFPDVIKENGIWFALILEILWEMFENSTFLINRYRMSKEFSYYNGDSIVNILGDIFMATLGYYIGIKTDKYSLIYVLVSEVILYYYKANLLFLSLGTLVFK